MVIEDLPEGTTHISRLKVYRAEGGRLEVTFWAFKYDGSILMVFHTDSDNEYPEWIPATKKFKIDPVVFPT